MNPTAVIHSVASTMWMCISVGGAKSQRQLEATCHNYKMDMVEQVLMRETIDHTPYLCVKAALIFYYKTHGVLKPNGWVKPNEGPVK